jgi:hypothetical protein
MTENVIHATSVIDQHYAIKAKVKVAGHAFVTAIINVFTTFIAAFLQFLIAYHNAPGIGRKERKELGLETTLTARILEDDELVTFCVGGKMFTTQLVHIISRKSTTLGVYVFGRRNFHDTAFIDRDGTHFRHIVNYLRGIY